LVDVAIRKDLGGVKNLDTPFEVSSLLAGNFDTAPVPEPGTLLLFGSCLLGLGITLYRKKKE
jgi:PEP-CTERM motif